MQFDSWDLVSFKIELESIDYRFPTVREVDGVNDVESYCLSELRLI